MIDSFLNELFFVPFLHTQCPWDSSTFYTFLFSSINLFTSDFFSAFGTLFLFNSSGEILAQFTPDNPLWGTMGGALVGQSGLFRTARGNEGLVLYLIDIGWGKFREQLYRLPHGIICVPCKASLTKTSLLLPLLIKSNLFAGHNSLFKKKQPYSSKYLYLYLV